MGSVLSGFTVDCGPHCVHVNEFGATQRLEHTCSATTRCSFSTHSEPAKGLRVNGDYDLIVCSVSLDSCCMMASLIIYGLFKPMVDRAITECSNSIVTHRRRHGYLN